MLRLMLKNVLVIPNNTLTICAYLCVYLPEERFTRLGAGLPEADFFPPPEAPTENAPPESPPPKLGAPKAGVC